MENNLVNLKHGVITNVRSLAVMGATNCVNGHDIFYGFKREEVVATTTAFETREDEKHGRVVTSTNGSNSFTTTTGNSSVPLMALNTTKAGMEGLDVDTINKIISGASEGSRFYEHKKKQQEKIDKKIEEMKFQLQKLTTDQIQQAQIQVDKVANQIDANLDLSRHYVHLDMDAFFASVEMRDDPSLRHIPMAVGCESMLSTSNYVARRYGVRAAMPGFIARKLCPQLKIISSNFKKYEEASKAVESVVRKYDANLFMCMDEADLDITDYIFECEQNHPEEDITSASVAALLRLEIELATKLTASAGIAPTRFLAKLCSDLNKPNGQYLLENTRPAIKSFLSTMPIRKVCGIGAVTEQMLKALDIHTCKDLWEKRAILSLLFKRATFQNLLGIAMGTGSSIFRDISTDSGGRKSLSCERTFMGTADLSFLENLCKSLCSEVEKDLKSASLCCKTITLKIKTTDYEIKTRARSIIQRTDSASKIFESAWKIFMSYVQEIPDLTIRLMGVRVSNLEEGVGNCSGTQKTIHQFLVDSQPAKVCDTADIDYDIRMNCPVCDIQIRSTTVPDAERLMDIHIDECLSKTKLKEVRSEVTASSAAASQRKRSSNNSTLTNNPKKLKRASEQPIDTFFRKL